MQCFLGFKNFYRKFIHDYSKLILPLTQLTKKGQSFVWTKEATTTFEGLKKAFTSAPVLGNVDSQKPFIIEADASNFAREQGDDENLHPVAFHSRKFDTIEINYAICDK